MVFLFLELFFFFNCGVTVTRNIRRLTVSNMTTEAGKKNIFWVLVQISFYSFFSQHACSKAWHFPLCLHTFLKSSKATAERRANKVAILRLSYSTPNNVDPSSPPPRQLVGILATRGAGVLRDEMLTIINQLILHVALSHIMPDSCHAHFSAQSKTGHRR